MSRLKLIQGAALGASVAYLFDPDHGAVRRRALAARIGRAIGIAGDPTGSNPGQTGLAGGRAARIVAILRSGGPVRRLFLRRGPGPAIDAWDAPMATVNIDIDQGTVTLSGIFPTVEDGPTGADNPPAGTDAVHLVDGRH
ncbi:MAG TPA: hypothetical protein VK990_04690 [Acidimicrobiia bacterium]|nr:hypothetical protein [Acidimicrobiia bacterium]